MNKHLPLIKEEKKGLRSVWITYSLIFKKLDIKNRIIKNVEVLHDRQCENFFRWQNEPVHCQVQFADQTQNVIKDIKFNRLHFFF